MKQTRKALALLLMCAFALTLTPVRATAAILQMDLPNFALGTDSASPTIVGFGGKQWVVIGHNGSGVVSTSGTLTLLAADEGFGISHYLNFIDENGNTDYNKPNVNNAYGGSLLQIAVNNAYDSLPQHEKKLVVPRTLAGGSGNDGSVTYNDDFIAGASVLDAGFWPLSVKEANQLNQETRKFSDWWWLRSPGTRDYFIALVLSDGGILSVDYAIELGGYRAYVRPACNIDLSSVVFTSAAVGGNKPDIASANLSPVAAPTGAVKFTIKDDSIPTVSVKDASARTAKPGDTMSIEYAAETPAALQGTRVTCIIADSGGTVLFYGKPITAAGTGASVASFTVPALPDGAYTIKLFYERNNGDNNTDLCGVPVSIPLTIIDSKETQTNSPTKAVTRSDASIAAGYYYSTVIKADNSLWAWGDNSYGQLGNNGISPKNQTPFKLMDGVVAVSTGDAHTMAIKTDGSLWGWGFNANGELGDGTTMHRFSPIKIMDDVMAVSAGSMYTMAIKTDGSLWAWGYNAEGELGDGTTTNRSSPVKITDDVVAVSAGYHTLAIKTDGSLWAWGKGKYGQLGNGSSKDSYVPLKVMDGVGTVSAGSDHSTIIKKDGSLWVCGWNYYGQLGNGTTENQYTYIKIMDGVATASASGRSTMAVKNDGSLWAWGCNEFGELGDNTMVYRQTPVKVMNGITAVSVGYDHAIAIKTDGSLWAWGENKYGQIGDGMAENRLVPVKIMDTGRIQPFSDVSPTHWAYSAIIDMAARGVVRGYPDGTFKPGTHVTRSEFAVMMTRALNIPLGTPVKPTFADVGINEWDYAYVESAKKYLTGYQQGEIYYFRGQEPAVREDMAVALVKAIKLENQQVDASELKAIFKDYDAISPNLRKFVLIAYKNGLMNGYPDKTFGAQRSITRAEAASLLVRVLNSDAVKTTFG